MTTDLQRRGVDPRSGVLDAWLAACVRVKSCVRRRRRWGAVVAMAVDVESSNLAAVVWIWIPEENELCFYAGG